MPNLVLLPSGDITTRKNSACICNHTIDVHHFLHGEYCGQCECQRYIDLNLAICIAIDGDNQANFVTLDTLFKQ